METVQSPFLFYCSFCSKEYKAKSRLEKHSMLCQIIYNANHKRSKKLRIEEEENEVPSQRRLYQMLLELGQKYNRLEEKVEEINKWVSKKKKKINIIEWLDVNVTPDISFDKVNELIIVTEDDIEYLFQHTVLETLHMLFTKTIYAMEERQRPIFTFQQKQGVFYVYEPSQEQDQEQQQDQVKWILLTREKLIQFLNRCHRKISKGLSDWKKQNNQKMQHSDRHAMEYDKTMSKVMSIDFKQEQIFSKFKNLFYNQLKVDIKSFIEYEFEF